MLAFFYYLRKYSFSKQLLKRDASSFEIEEAHVHIIRIDIPSCSWALLGSYDFVNSTISAE